MSSAPAVYEAVRHLETTNGRQQGGGLTHEDMEVLRATVLKDATDAQLTMYGRSCAKLGLDPFSREVYGFVNRDGGIDVVISIDGLRKQAEKSGQYRGQSRQQWCGPDGEWKDVWLKKEPPAAARITVHREGHEPFTGVALWSEYGRNTQTWQKYPTVMLSKCSESNALRHLFPHQTGSLYIIEEMPGRGADVVEATLVNRESGEVTATPALTLNDDIKRLREHLGWSAQDVIAEALNAFTNPETGEIEPPINLKTREGRQAMHDRLQVMVDTVNQEPSPGIAGEELELPFPEAEFRVAGGPGDDEYTA